MTTATRTTAQALRRVSFTFAADGSHAACLASADGSWYAESWRLGPAPGRAVPTALPQPGNRSESLRSQLVSLPDGRVLICRHRGGERHDLAVLGPRADGSTAAVERLIGTVRLPGLRLLPLPPPPGPHPAPHAPVAVALGTDGHPVTHVWLVTADSSPLRQVAELPGVYGGGVWLDRAGRLLALDRVRDDDGLVKSVVLDLATGTATPLLEIAEHSNDRVVLADPASGLLLVRSDAPGTDRLGWGVLGGRDPLRFPECLHQPGLLLRPVAIEPAVAPDGGPLPPERLRVAVQLDRGAGSALAVWQPATGRLDPLPVPPGRLGAVGHWSAAGLRMPYSSPDRPAALATLDVDTLLQAGAVASGCAPPGWRLDGSALPGDGGRWYPAQTVELPGPGGPVEAIVYGGDSWLDARHLVIALHGGPADAWRLEFDPALQRMAAEGLAVLAPNQRGSSGYGLEHALAVRGAWGGPDLEDILALLAGVAGRRASLGLEPPALFGVSYGAFLALLTACHAPGGQVARCAVVAPFLSGARLLADASPPVQALTARLGGADPVHDRRGPRDVLRLCHRIAAPLLVVHGDRDEVVPVDHSRALRQELLRIGRVEGVDFRYVEAAGAGHEALAEEGAPVLYELLAGFLRTGRPG